MSRALIIVGLAIAGLGVVWPWLGRLGLGRLPGDVVVQRDHFTLYVPIVTCLVLSVVISVVLWLINR
ncbi:MAG TPA: DUF2905 domain-containing protein [Stellaceae bacterium]|nr:DUF2905 domain-containing protein [Stellaceae bacterium]